MARLHSPCPLPKLKIFDAFQPGLHGREQTTMARLHSPCSWPKLKNFDGRTDEVVLFGRGWHVPSKKKGGGWHASIGIGRRLLYAATRDIIMTPMKSMLILLDVLLSVISSVLYALLGFLTPLSPSEWGQLFSPILGGERVVPMEVRLSAIFSVKKGGPGEPWAREYSLFSQFPEKNFMKIAYDAIRIVTGGYAIPSALEMGGGLCFVSKCTSTRTVAASIQNPHVWYYDTCSTYSMTGNPDLLEGMHPAPHITCSSATRHTMSSYQCGRVIGTVNLSGVRYFPGAPNLISGGHLRRLGCAVTIDEWGCTITNRYGRVIGKGRLLENNMTTIDFLGDSSLGSLCHGCPGQS